MPLISFCNRERLRAHLQTTQSSLSGTSPEMRVAPTEVGGEPDCCRLGTSTACADVGHHRSDRSLQWSYPNLLGPDTSCHPLL